MWIELALGLRGGSWLERLIYEGWTNGGGSHLETGVARCSPGGRHGLEDEAVVHHLQLRTHHHLP